jgi:hypothetical protein
MPRLVAPIVWDEVLILRVETHTSEDRVAEEATTMKVSVQG